MLLVSYPERLVTKLNCSRTALSSYQSSDQLSSPTLLRSPSSASSAPLDASPSSFADGQAQASETGSTDTGSHKGALIGGIIAAIILIVLALLLGLFCFRKSLARKRATSQMAANRADPYAPMAQTDQHDAAAAALRRSPSDKSVVSYRVPVTAGHMTRRTAASSQAGSSGVADPEHEAGPWEGMAAGSNNGSHRVGVPSQEDDEHVAAPDAAFLARPGSDATSYFPARPPPGQAQNELKVVNVSHPCKSAGLS